MKALICHLHNIKALMGKKKYTYAYLWFWMPSKTYHGKIKKEIIPKSGFIRVSYGNFFDFWTDLWTVSCCTYFSCRSNSHHEKYLVQQTHILNKEKWEQIDSTSRTNYNHDWCMTTTKKRPTCHLHMKSLIGEKKNKE